MSGITRRTFLGAMSTTLGLTVVDGLHAAPAAHAGQPAGAGLAPHEDIVRDARMTWRRLPEDWRSAPFFGSGDLTAQVHRGERANELDFVLSNGPLPANAQTSSALVLGLAGAVTTVDWTLDLWNAELTGKVTTTRGSVAFSALVPAQRHVLLVELAPSSGEAAVGWRVRLPPGAHDVALPWRERRSGTRRLLVAALTPQQRREASVLREAAAGPAALVAAHRRWWHSYYRQSLVSVPDKGIQRFFCIQLFKAASTGLTASRAGVVHPFLQTANHGGVDAGGLWTPPTAPAGGFGIPGTGIRSGQHANPIEVWGLPELWSSYRHSMDERVLRERLYPALVKALAFYEQFLIEGPTGKLHLPLTHSPGYADVADCTYDLSLLRWAAARATDSATLLDRPAADIARWREMSTRLTPYHRNARGVMIGAGVPLGRSNPLPSHLLWLYPLRERRWDRGTDRHVMRRSFDHWARMRESWHGRSYSAASSMAAAMDAAEEAHSYLSHVLHDPAGADTGLTGNTRYGEAGRPVDAGAFAAAGSLLDMLVRSGDRPGTGTVVELFPAVCADWRDVSIAGLRTEGAFVVDASRADGRTEWIRVRSETGAPLVVRHDIDGPVDVRTTSGRPKTLPSAGSREVVVHLKPGESAVLTPGGAPLPDAFPRNVAATGTARRWGLPTAGAPPGSTV
jgi:alpha-L-fucosidase 2